MLSGPNSLPVPEIRGTEIRARLPKEFWAGKIAGLNQALPMETRGQCKYPHFHDQQANFPWIAGDKRSHLLRLRSRSRP